MAQLAILNWQALPFSTLHVRACETKCFFFVFRYAALLCGLNSISSMPWPLTFAAAVYHSVVRYWLTLVAKQSALTPH